MANLKISQLTADTTPTHDDLLVSVHDPAGTPVNKKVTIASLFAALAKMVFAEDAGANDTYTATLSPVPAAYVTGQHYRFKANTANTGAATINFNALGAKTIKKPAGGITTDLVTNDIRAGQWVDLVYDGTNMQMQSLLGNAPAGGGGPATQIDETGGPTTLDIAAIADGQFLKRSGTDIVGDAPTASIAPLVIEDANTVSQRNSTNNQNLSIHRNYVSGTDFQRIRIGWTGTAAEIMSEAQTQGASNIIFRVGSTSTHGLNFANTSLVPVTDVTMTLGSSGSFFSEIYTNIYIAKSAGQYRWASRARLHSPADGILRITDDSQNSGSGTVRFDSRTPSQITSDQNNYSVPVTGYFIRLSTDASRTLTGLVFTGGGVGDGQVHLLVNVGANDLVLAHENASSTAGNRFLCSTGASITLSANQAADLIYDSTTARWRVFKRN